MFSAITNLGSMIKKMHQINGKVKEMNDKCREIRATGTAGAGLVSVEVNGVFEMLGCTIDPTVFKQGDAELLEDLIITAVNEAMDQAREKQSEMLRSLSGSMDIPEFDGIKEMLGKMGIDGNDVK